MQNVANRSLRETYSAALREYLADAGEAPLQRAYEIGRSAIGAGLGVLDLVAVHAETLEGLLGERREPVPCARVCAASGRFLAEGLSPYEMTHRGFQEAVETLRSLNERLEDEARRIAHALHDDAGQLLVSIHLAIEAVAADMPARSRGRLDRVRELLDEAEKNLRRIAHELRPTILDDLGLVPALRFLAHGVAARAGITIRVEGALRTRLRPPVETAAYRVVQEALRNAVKHAYATTVQVRLEHGPDAVRLWVKDDGRGFDPGSVLRRSGTRGLGLGAMRERLNSLGGQLTIDSAPGRGTEVHIVIPIVEGPDADAAVAGR
jgi:signal transduction histidine kinase